MKTFRILLLATFLAGILFGYTTGIIAGALEFIAKDFMLSTWEMGLVVSFLLLGMMVGSLATGKISDRLGRKGAFSIMMLLFLVTNLASYALNGLGTLLVFRLANGVAVGMASALMPVFIAESISPEYRGRCITYFQLAITLGIFLAYLVNFVFVDTGNWRLMFFLAAPLSAFSLFLLPKLSESPAFIQADTKMDKQPFFSLFQKKYIKVLLIGLSLSIFQQLTGINTIFYYAQKILQLGHLTSHNAFLLAIMIAGINILATLLAVYLIDRWGRRPLLLSGTALMALSLSAVALSLNKPGLEAIAFASVVVYIIAFAISLGPITYIIVAEIFPEGFRARAVSLCLFLNNMTNALVALLFLPAIGRFGALSVFFFFGLISLIAFFFIYFLIPETKGKNLLEIQKMIQGLKNKKVSQ